MTIKVFNFHGAQGGGAGDLLAADLDPLVTLGTATGGTDTTAVDDTQTWADNAYAGRALVLDRDGTRSRHAVIANGADSFVFAPALGTATEASALIGSGEDDEGQIAVTLVEKGAEGNDWVMQLIAGTTDTGLDSATADVEAKTITVVIDSDGNGDPRPLMAGSLQAILEAHVPGHVMGALDFVAGALPLGTEADPVVVSFSGGADAPSVTAGDRYWLIDQSAVAAHEATYDHQSLLLEGS